MKTKCLFFVISFLVYMQQNAFAGIVYPTAKITVRAVDSNGSPITGAKVILQFHTEKTAGKGWGVETEFVEGKTDNDGKFAGSGDSINYSNISVIKEGFYSSYEQFNFKNASILRQWEPWNPVIDVVLKEKKNPTAMFAKKTDLIKVPIIDKSVGYDLEKGDWVTPYGAGINNDFIFSCLFKYISRDDWECSYKLTFLNELDGIQEFFPNKENRSDFFWPYEAMVNGYSREILWSNGFNNDNRTKYKSTRNDFRNYVFRIRTKMDSKGNLISALYGKVNGDIIFYPDAAQNGYFKFEYYLNPSGTRSLEYDKNKPLFKWNNRKEKDKYEVNGP